MNYKQYKEQILLNPKSSKLDFNEDGRFHCVYRISHIIKNEHYYGSRTSHKNPIDDIGVTYFSTSSNKEFLRDQQKQPHNYRYKIIKTFTNPAEKMIFESFLHYKFNVKNEMNFYNKTNQTPYGFDNTGNREIALKISKSLTGKEGGNRGRKFSEEWKRKIGKGNEGKIVSIKTRDKMSKNHADINGINNPKAKIIEIFNERGILEYSTYGNFKQICEKYNLPFSALKRSYQDGGKKILSKNNLSFKHWFAKAIK